MNPSEVIAIPAGVKARTGSIVYWSLHGLVRHELLKETAADQGVAERHVPRVPSASKCLRLALRQVASTDPHIIVRRHPRGGHTLVHESIDHDRLRYETDSRVHIGDDGTPEFEGDCLGLEPQIESVYERYSVSLTTQSVGQMLSAYATGPCQGVSLRPAGGFYFVPPAGMEQWNAMTRALDLVSDHEIFKIPAMAVEDGVGAILQAVIHEADGELERAQEWLADAEGKPERSRKAALRRLEAATDKVAMYEELLGRAAGEFTERMESMKLQIAEAVLEEGGEDGDA